MSKSLWDKAFEFATNLDKRLVVHNHEVDEFKSVVAQALSSERSERVAIMNANYTSIQSAQTSHEYIPVVELSPQEFDDYQRLSSLVMCLNTNLPVSARDELFNILKYKTDNTSDRGAVAFIICHLMISDECIYDSEVSESDLRSLIAQSLKKSH